MLYAAGGLIFAVNDCHFCQSPVSGTGTVPSSSPSGCVQADFDDRRRAVAEAARISTLSVRGAEIHPLVTHPVAVLR